MGRNYVCYLLLTNVFRTYVKYRILFFNTFYSAKFNCLNNTQLLVKKRGETVVALSQADPEQNNGWGGGLKMYRANPNAKIQSKYYGIFSLHLYYKFSLITTYILPLSVFCR